MLIMIVMLTGCVETQKKKTFKQKYREDPELCNNVIDRIRNMVYQVAYERQQARKNKQMEEMTRD